MGSSSLDATRLAVAFALVAGPAVLNGCEAVAAQAPTRRALRDSIAVARDSLARAQGDSAILLLQLARQLHRLGKPQEGRAALIAAASSVTLAGRAAFDRDLLVGNPGMIYEKAHWDSLSPPMRSAVVAVQWDDCDVDEELPVGGCMIAQYQRVAYAEDHFRIDRGPQAGELDDRGKVLIRQGLPEAVRRIHAGARYEFWRYQRPFGTLILYFRSADGDDEGPLSLVASVEESPRKVKLTACKLDRESCTPGRSPQPIAGKFTAPETPPPGYNAAHMRPQPGPARTVRGAEAVAYARRVRFQYSPSPRGLRGSTQILRLNSLNGDRPQFVTAFAFKPGQLQNNGRTGVGARLRCHLIVLELGGRRSELDTSFVLRPRDLAHGDSTMIGVLALPLPAGRNKLSLTVTQADGRGMRFVDEGDGIDPTYALRPEAVLPLSFGIVVGRSSSGMKWVQDTVTALLNPERVFEVGDTVHAYIETKGLLGIGAVRGRMVFGDGSEPSREHRLVVQDVAIQRVDERIGHRFSFPLDTVAPGKYHLSFGIWWSLAGSKAESGAFMVDTFTVLPRKRP